MASSLIFSPAQREWSVVRVWFDGTRLWELVRILAGPLDTIPVDHLDIVKMISGGWEVGNSMKEKDRGVEIHQ